MNELINKKIKEFIQIFGVYESKSAGYTAYTIHNNDLEVLHLVLDSREWLKQALEQIYIAGVQEGAEEMKSCLQDATEAAYFRGLDTCKKITNLLIK